MRKKSLTKTKVQENIAKVFESIAVLIVSAYIVAVVILWLF